MPKKKKPFSTWLIEKYNLNVQDMGETNHPWFWRKFTKAGAFAVRKKDVYIRNLDNLSETILSRKLLHELRHILRQRKLGWRIFLIRYGLSKSFRASEEVMAFTRSMEARKVLGHTDISPHFYANVIKDAYYVGDYQYQKARKKLYEKHGQIGRGEIHVVRDLWDEYHRYLAS